jgi:hypothetical protein
MKVMGPQRRHPLHLVTATAERRTDGDDARTPLDLELRAALTLVASRAATSVTLCGFCDDATDLRAVLSDSLDTDGLVIEPVVRPGGGGFDIRVRRTEAAS